MATVKFIQGLYDILLCLLLLCCNIYSWIYIRFGQIAVLVTNNFSELSNVDVAEAVAVACS